MEDEFCELINHPGGAALIHYPESWGLGDSPTPEQIVDAAINWRPEILTMTVKSVQPHYKLGGWYVYEVTAGNMQTQVVSNLRLAPGQHCEVAMSGAVLPNGTITKHDFIEGVFTAGEIVTPAAH